MTVERAPILPNPPREYDEVYMRGLVSRIERALLDHARALGVVTVGAIEPETLIPAGGWWKSDVPPPVSNYYLPGRVFIGAGAFNSDERTTGDNWLVTDLGAGSRSLFRGSHMVALARQGGTVATFATRASDRYRSPMQTITVPAWATGQSVVAGAQRARLGYVYQATNSGTTGAPGPSHTSGIVADGGGVSWLMANDRGAAFTPTVSFRLGYADIADGVQTVVDQVEAIRESGAGSIYGQILIAKNKGSNVLSNPYAHAPADATMGVLLVGGGASTYGGSPANPSTAAITISDDLAKWNAGIVFEAGAMATIDGRQRAVMLGPNQAVQWWNSSSSVAFELRCDAVSSPAPTRLVSTGSALEVRSLTAGGIEDPVLVIDQPDLTGASRRANALRIYASVNTGGTPADGFTSIKAQGYDSNLDVYAEPKGTGLFGFGYLTTAATLPSAFTADRMLRIKDNSGNVYIVPCRVAAW